MEDNLVLDDSDNNGTDGTGSVDIQMRDDEDASALQEQEPHPNDLAAQKSATSAVTDFTRRRNWTQRILAVMQGVLMVLSPYGKVLYCSPGIKPIIDHEPKDLEGKLLLEFMHDDDRTNFIREFNESIATGHRLRYYFRFRKPNREFAIVETLGHAHMSNEKITLETGKEGNPCDGFFLVCCPYPTASNVLLDSFLEHKIEDIRLKRRIADLKIEEEEELRAQQLPILETDTSRTISLDEDNDAFNNISNTPAAGGPGMMLPPARSSHSSSGQNGRTSMSTLDRNVDTISRSYTSTVLDSIEMLSGPQHVGGEISRDLSTSQKRIALTQEQAYLHQLGLCSGGDDRKKRSKTSEEYLCTDCGTLASPQWRKGPYGPKTLCNTCGLRWAKKESKRRESTQPSNQF